MFKLNDAISDMFSSEVGSKIYDRIVSTIEDESMSTYIDDGLLLGFSGGADSVFLLCFLTEYKNRNKKCFPLIAVHINHCIRGDEACRDESFSSEIAGALKVEFKSYHIDVPAMSKEYGMGIEEAARNARYSTFNNLIKSRNDISNIAVAHNSTDNAETVVMNILRGSGLSGVCGIKPVRDNIIRPLIRISKSEILNLLNQYEIPYVIDSTNLSTDYSRNYVRNEILPLFGRLTNNPEYSFTKLTENLRMDLDFMNSQAREFITNHKYTKITNTELLTLHPAIQARVISMLAYENSKEYPEEKHITAIRKFLVSDNFRYSLPGKCDFICQRGVCTFSDKNNKNKLSEQIFSLDKGENKISGTNLTVFVGEIDKSFLNVYNFSIQALVSSDIIDGSLFLRFKSDGDAYKYGGMTHKLKKVFNDRNIPPMERDLIPVVCDSQGILIIPGMSVRDDAKGVNANTTPITFAYAQKQDNEIEVFTALLRK